MYQALQPIVFVVFGAVQVSKLRDRWLEFSNCTTDEAPAKFQSDTIILTPNLAPLRLCEILRWDVLCDTALVPWPYDCLVALSSLQAKSQILLGFGFYLSHDNVFFKNIIRPCNTHTINFQTTILAALGLRLNRKMFNNYVNWYWTSI